MLREIILLKDQDHLVHFPKEYVNHKIEIIAFPLGEDDKELSHTTSKRKPFGLGCMKGKIKMSDDFDEPLDDFKEYM